MNLKELTAKDLEAVTRLSAAAFTPKELSIHFDIPVGDIKAAIKDEECDFYKAYMKGQLQTKLLLNERIFKDANNGSSPAQTLALKLLDECRINTIK